MRTAKILSICTGQQKLDTSQFIIYAFYTECRHIAHNTLHWAVDINSGKYQIWIHFPRFARFFIPVMLRPALYSRNFTAFMRICVRNFQPCVQPYFGAQPPVSMRWIFQMIFPEQNDIFCKGFCFWRRITKPFLPIIKTAPPDAHGFA